MSRPTDAVHLARRDQRGFTLIELLIVVGVVGGQAAIARAP
jgi:prepilin-type N-terminal cleavage/methylation domain-containing protein